MDFNVLKDRYWSIFPCSAISGEGVKDGMQNLMEYINTQKGTK